MKRTYLNPNIKVVKISSHVQVLADSFTKDAQDNLTGGTLKNENATGAGMGRGFDFDDEEE